MDTSTPSDDMAVATDDTTRQTAPTSRVTVAGPETPLVARLGLLVLIAGVLLSLAGVGTWFTVQSQLAAENITVAEDADMLSGDEVNGPFSAFAQAEIINAHALEASDGLTYAELDQDDPVRATMMNASFLRASLFTSVVAFGIAAMAFGLGVLFMLVGWALRKIGDVQVA